MRSDDQIVQLLPSSGQYAVFDDDGLMSIAPLAMFGLMESGDVVPLWAEWDTGFLQDPTECANFVALVPRRRECETAWDDYRDSKRKGGLTCWRAPAGGSRGGSC